MSLAPHSPASVTSLGLIGFGEVGQALAEGLKPIVNDIAAYDILFDDPIEGPALHDAAIQHEVRAADVPAEMAEEGRLILSCVTASSAIDAVTEAANWLKPGQFYLDVNSISPQGKREGAQIVGDAGGRYVEAAIMSPIHPKRHASPMLFGGPDAAELAETLITWGMNIMVESEEIGLASANKMCRSIMVKGIEALVVECLVTARHYGVDEKVLSSLEATFPGMDWRNSAQYMLERVLTHGKRRAEEMRFSAKTVDAAGWPSLMAAATAERQQWVVDTIPREEALKLGKEDLDTILDRLARELRG